MSEDCKDTYNKKKIKTTGFAVERKDVVRFL